MTAPTRPLPLLLATAVLGLLAGLLAPGGPASAALATDRPIITHVEGDPANGFTLTYADGSTLSPPTDSEAAAECSEYDTRLDRVRCRVEVRTWYRDLGDLQRSLAWVRAHE
ncbi:hypothetical protein [Nocardioides litoris]|uniref:hypothetical protein n=1 Tax=Nocardioides litoris TaxID=1926648 RepID=UPI001B86FFD9|nr:hypothetical protein [Nocardioides litoris]